MQKVQVIASIREAYGEAIPFILCTALTSLEAGRLAQEARCVAYICKPYTSQAVVELVRLHAHSS